MHGTCDEPSFKTLGCDKFSYVSPTARHTLILDKLDLDIAAVGTGRGTREDTDRLDDAALAADDFSGVIGSDANLDEFGSAFGKRRGHHDRLFVFDERLDDFTHQSDDVG